jgi:hypothetical protein
VVRQGHRGGPAPAVRARPARRGHEVPPVRSSDRLFDHPLRDLVAATAVLVGGMLVGATIAHATQSLSAQSLSARSPAAPATAPAITVVCTVDGLVVSGASVRSRSGAAGVLEGGLVGAGPGEACGGDRDADGPGVDESAAAGAAGRPEVDMDGSTGAAGRDPDQDAARDDTDAEPEPEPEPVWNRLAECESSGDWSLDTGNGYYGGLQFDEPTWRDFGGREVARRADQATKEQQIEVATRVRDARGGYGSWPACAAELGLSR